MTKRSLQQGKESGGEETVLYYHFGGGHILLCIHRNPENIIICKEGEGRRQPGIMGGQNERVTNEECNYTTVNSIRVQKREGRKELAAVLEKHNSDCML